MIIRGLRLRDTRNGEKKVLIKELGGTVYFSDGTNCTMEEYEKFFVLVNTSDSK